MDGFHARNIFIRPQYMHWASRPSVALGLVLVVLALIGWTCLRTGSRHSENNGLPGDVGTRLADLPSWDRPKPQWPKYLAALPTVQPVITPTGTYAPAPPPALPCIAAGPELFASPSASTATAPSRPSTVSVPLELVASRPIELAPATALDLAADPAPSEAPTPAPPPARLPVTGPLHSESMEKIALQSDQQIRRGFALANRGAFFAARAEFTAALRLTAQGLDDQRNTTVHSQALSAGLTALKEAQDFIPADGKLEGELDLQAIITGHRTPVAKGIPADQLQAMRALKQYFTFAQEQFALAAGQEVSGSMALAALGKTHAALAGKPNPEIIAPEAKAIVFFQAALLVCPKNYMAANDLGVLLAHNGDYTGARRLLEHSVLVCRCSENLYNLGVVYRQAGQLRLAELALEKARLAKAAENARQKHGSLSADGRVEWVDSSALAESADPWWSDPTGSTAMPAAPLRTQPVTTANAAPAAPPGQSIVRRRRRCRPRHFDRDGRLTCLIVGD